MSTLMGLLGVWVPLTGLGYYTDTLALADLMNCVFGTGWSRGHDHIIHFARIAAPLHDL